MKHRAGNISVVTVALLLAGGCAGESEPDVGGGGGGDGSSDGTGSTGGDSGGTTGGSSDSTGSGTTGLDPCDAIVAQWRGDGDTLDSVGDHDLIRPGGDPPVFVQGVDDMAFSLDGYYLEAPDALTLDVTEITIHAWIRATALGGRILDKTSVDTTDGYLLDTHQGNLRLMAGSAHLWSTSTLPTDEWVWVAGTFDGSMLRVFIGGEADGEVAGQTVGQVNDLSLRVGAASDGGGLFTGAIDELTLHSRALSAEEIAALFAADGLCR
jgi:hypothetical protein